MTHTKYFEKFIKMFMSESNKEKSGEEIYNELEEWHIKLCGSRKCKDYNSFRSLKSQYYKASRPRNT